jgi:anti-sigma B factor antagonist
MQINTRSVKDLLIIDIIGEFELYESSKILETVEKKIKEDKIKKFIFNLDNVTYVDSSGIKTLITCKERVMDAEGDLILINIQGSIKRIFELTKLIDFFSIKKTEAQAIESLSASI